MLVVDNNCLYLYVHGLNNWLCHDRIMQIGFSMLSLLRKFLISLVFFFIFFAIFFKNVCLCLGIGYYYLPFCQNHFPFLGATKHLYNWLSVGWLVGLSVTHLFDDQHVAPYWPTWPCYHRNSLFSPSVVSKSR